MFDTFVGYVLYVASIAMTGIIFPLTVSDLLSFLGHEKGTSNCTIESFCLIIFISKDTISHHISWDATMLKTKLALPACSVTFARSRIYKDSLRLILVDKGYFKT